MVQITKFKQIEEKKVNCEKIGVYREISTKIVYKCRLKDQKRFGFIILFKKSKSFKISDWLNIINVYQRY